MGHQFLLSNTFTKKNANTEGRALNRYLYTMFRAALFTGAKSGNNVKSHQQINGYKYNVVCPYSGTLFNLKKE